MKNSPNLDFFKNFPLFEVLSTDEMDQLLEMVELKKVSKFDYIFNVGDTSNFVCFLIKGIVKIGSLSEDGREVIKSILHPMAMFGELSLVGENNRKDFAISMNEEIHNITGTSRQTVTSVLNELKRSDLIYFNRRSILIRDIARLA